MEKIKILYVDDEKANLLNFKIAFKRHFEIFTAMDGREALEIFDDHPDIAIVVADQRMPGMTGVELLSEILSINADVIRIILTAYTDVADIIDSINKGRIFHYIVKPWDENELLQLLNKAQNTYLLVQENKRLLHELDEKNRALKADIEERKRIEGVLLRRDMVLAAVNVLARELLLNREWQPFIEGLIGRLGLVMAVSRVHVFQHHEDENGDLLASQRFEWIAEGIPPLINEPIQHNFSYDKLNFSRWIETFRQGELIYGNTRNFPEEELPWLYNNQILSIASAPILVNRRCWGFIGFEDCQSEREWATPELDALKTAASLIGTAIQREKMEVNLAKKQAQLAHAGRLTALGEMASGIGHEIHQPLTVINLGAETCREYFKGRDPDSPAAEAAEDMRVQVKKITNIINNMRSFSRASSGEWRKISLTKPANEALTFFREQFRIHMIEFVELVNENLPLVLTDSQKFEQIVVNFLSNARYAVDLKQEKNPDHKKEITMFLDFKNLTERELSDLDFKKDDNTSRQVIVFEIRDNGVGMSEEVKRRCLEPFFTTKEVGEGTGLGLSVTLGIIKELNFHLEIESNLGEGSVFRVIVPVDKRDCIP